MVREGGKVGVPREGLRLFASGSGVQGVEVKVWRLGLMSCTRVRTGWVWGLEFRVRGSGFRGEGLRFRVQDPGVRF